MNYLNIHLLFTFAAGNPNRDDFGVPKTVIYGGAERSRISSQAMTRPKRLYLEKTDEPTYRSKFHDRNIAHGVIDLAEAHGTRVTDALGEKIFKAAKEKVDELTKNKDKKSQDGKDKKDTTIWLGSKEIDTAIAQIFDKLIAKGQADGSTGTDFLSNQTTSLSIASFGRMFANAPKLQNEAAIQRSHAFTTHAANVDVDYFTAVGDLPNDKEDNGADHLNLALLTGGVYYWHCNLDIRQLAKTWLGIREDDARERLINLFDALAWGLPTGRANTTAYRGAPSLIVVQPALSPVSLQSAFETPVEPEYHQGHLQPSANALLEELHFVSGLQPSHFEDAHLVLASSSLSELGAKGVTTENNLDDMAGWFADYVLDEVGGA